MRKVNLRTDCRKLAQQIMELPSETPEDLWLKAAVARILLDRQMINELSSEYQQEQDIQNPYLAYLIQRYEQTS